METIGTVVSCEPGGMYSPEWGRDAGSFADALPLPVWRHNAQGKLVAANRFLRDLVGTSPDVDRFLLATDLAPFWAAVAVRMARAIDVRIRRLDGKLLPFRLSLVPDPDGGCLVSGQALTERPVPEVVQDIEGGEAPQAWLIELNERLEMQVAERTAELRIAIGELVARVHEKEEIESALRRSEEWFRMIADTLPHIVWSVNAEGNFDFCNQRWFEYLGVASPEDGNDWSAFIHPEDVHVMRARWQKAVETGEPYEAEYRLRRFDGAYRWILARALPQRNETGEVIRWFGSCTDLEDHKQLEARNRAEQDRLRLALEAACAGAWELDMQTHAVVWSDEMYDLHGVSRDEADPGSAAVKRMHGEDPPKIRQALAAAARGSRFTEFEFRVQHPTKGLRWLRAKGITLLDSSGRPNRIVGITEDTTERKLAEQELERRVAERTSELEGFTYTVSHDLRAPLRALISTSRILIDEAGPKLSSEERRLLERQAFNASRLGLLIDELLQLTRLSRQEMRRESINLTYLAHEVADEMLRRTWPNPIYFEIEEGMVVHADPTLIRFVLGNLLENACKFSPKGGTIRLQRVGDAFCVSDEGIGFDPQYAGKLFLAFERLVPEDQFPGTGIGLANVKKIIDRHDGKVWAEGAVGKGARFFFTLGASAGLVESTPSTVQNQGLDRE